MFFGFCGTPESIIEWEAPSEISSTNRLFHFQHAATANNAQRTVFDADSVNVVKANFEALLTASNVTYTGKTKTILTTYSLVTGGNGYAVIGVTGSATQYDQTQLATNQLRRFQYTGTTQLSPVLRKVRQIVDYYSLRTISIQGVASSSTAINTVLGNTFTINSNAYPYLEGIHFVGVGMTTLNLKLLDNGRLKYFNLNATQLLTTINGQLPSSVTSSILSLIGTITSVNTLLANCVNMVSLLFEATAFSSGTNTLTGALSVSHMTLLKEFSIRNNGGLTSISLPLGKTDWTWFKTLGNASLSISSTILTDLFASPNLRVFIVTATNITLSKNIGNSDIASSLLVFNIYQNSISGNISITTAKTNLKDFRTGNNTARTGTQQNSFPTVDITGLINATSIDLSGCNISDLQLPVNTVCTLLDLHDNKLDIVTNPNLLSQINAMTALTTLRLGDQTNVSTSTGQNSTNGIGTNPSLISLSNVTILSVNACKIVGTLTVYNSPKLIDLYVSNNPSLTSITNLSSHYSTLTSFYAYNCTVLTNNITSSFTAIDTIQISGTPLMTTIDFSGRTTVVPFLMTVTNMAGLTSIVFPSSTATGLITLGGGVSITNNPLLTTLTNFNNISFTTTSGSINTITISGNPLLNIAFPFGVMAVPPKTITLTSNGMSTANVDSTIDSIYSNATKWDSYTGAKTLSIAGTNASPSGIYQFSATPTTGKEKIYYLVVTKGWTVNYTP